MLTPYGQEKFGRFILNWENMPATIYLALLTSVPSITESEATMAAREPTAADYNRFPVYTSEVNWTYLNGVWTYTYAIDQTVTEDWGSIVYWALCTSASGGNVYSMDPVTSISVLDGYRIILQNDIVIAVSA